MCRFSLAFSGALSLALVAGDGAASPVASPSVVSAAPQSAPQGAPPAEPARAWYLPDHVKLQFAGQIGFISPGVGYAFLRDRIETDLFFGWVPRAIGGVDIFCVTVKLVFLPLAFGEQVRVQPLAFGLLASYTFGERFFVVPPDTYAAGYWGFQTAIRPAVLFGGAVSVPWREQRIGLYYELVANDFGLSLWLDNSSFLLTDLLSFALGARLSF